MSATSESTPTTPGKTRVGTKTAYHILRRIGPDPRGSMPNPPAMPTYELVGENIEAANGREAIRAYVTKAKAAGGQFVPVPSRSFAEVAVQTETTTVVKLT